MMNNGYDYAQTLSAQEIYAERFNTSRRAYSRLGLAVVVLFAVYLGASYGLAFFSAYFLPDVYGQWWFDWVLNLVPLYCFALPAFYLCLRFADKGAHNTTYVSGGYIYEKPKFHIGHFLLFAVVCFGLMYIGSLVGNGLMALLSEKVGYDYQNNLNSLAEDSPWWMLLIGTVIIAPIGEEFLFRKLLIDRARRYGDGVAILLSALLFALFHGNFFQFFYAFLVGVVMAYAYTLSGKLYWSAGLHMFMNLMGMMVIPNVAKWLGLEEMQAIDSEDVDAMTEYIMAHAGEYALLMLFTGFIYCAMLAAIIIIIYHFCAKKVYIGQGEMPLMRSSDGFLAGFCNVGVLVCIGLLMAFMLLKLIPPPTA